MAEGFVQRCLTGGVPHPTTDAELCGGFGGRAAGQTVARSSFTFRNFYKLLLNILLNFINSLLDLLKTCLGVLFRFCPGEPLALEEALERLPPGLRDVKNTFIHSAATPLVTPEPAGYRRSRSVPKEVGYAEEAEAEGVVPSPAFLVPPTPSSPLFSRGYEAWLMPQDMMPNRVAQLQHAAAVDVL